MTLQTKLCHVVCFELFIKAYLGWTLTYQFSKAATDIMTLIFCIICAAAVKMFVVSCVAVT